jgi:hypothetical protein
MDLGPTKRCAPTGFDAFRFLSPTGFYTCRDEGEVQYTAIPTCRPGWHLHRGAHLRVWCERPVRHFFMFFLFFLYFFRFLFPFLMFSVFLFPVFSLYFLFKNIFFIFSNLKSVQV